MATNKPKKQKPAPKVDKTEQAGSKQEIKFNIGQIIDMQSCLKQLTDNQANVESMYALSALLRPAFTDGMKVYFTGIGKPGYVAMKQAATMKSIMADAQYVDACTAGHGDLGSIPVQKASLLIAFSKSGGSKELYDLFRVLKQLRPNCKIALVCMSNDEQFERVQDCKNIDFPVRFILDIKELDGNGIVPTTSNALFEIIMGTAIGNSVDMSIGLETMFRALQMSHPSGTLQNKVAALLRMIDAQKAAQAEAASKQVTGKETPAEEPKSPETPEAPAEQ